VGEESGRQIRDGGAEKEQGFNVCLQAVGYRGTHTDCELVVVGGRGEIGEYEVVRQKDLAEAGEELPGEGRTGVPVVGIAFDGW